MLLINHLTPEEIHQRGVPVLDVFLQQEAHRRNKRSGAMETVREQCQSLNNLNLKQVGYCITIKMACAHMKFVLTNLKRSSIFLEVATEIFILSINRVKWNSLNVLK